MSIGGTFFRCQPQLKSKNERQRPVVSYPPIRVTIGASFSRVSRSHPQLDVSTSCNINTILLGARIEGVDLVLQLCWKIYFSHGVSSRWAENGLGRAPFMVVVLDVLKPAHSASWQRGSRHQRQRDISQRWGKPSFWRIPPRRCQPPPPAPSSASEVGSFGTELQNCRT